MTNPLLGSLAKSLYDAFNSTLAYKLTLHSVAETEGSDGSITQVETDHTVKGMIVEYGDRVRFEGLVPDGARRCIVFQNSTSTEVKMFDRITATVGPFADQKMVVEKVAQDPAGAIWDAMLLPFREG